MLPGYHHLLSLDFRRCADDGKFVLQLGLQLTSVLPSPLVSTGSLLFVTGRGLLAPALAFSTTSVASEMAFAITALLRSSCSLPTSSLRWLARSSCD